MGDAGPRNGEEKIAMSTIVVQAFMTLDGVVQAVYGPDEDGEGGFEHGGWQNSQLLGPDVPAREGCVRKPAVRSGCGGVPS